MKYTRRILAVLLTAAMLLSLLPATALAADDGTGSGGGVTIDVTEYGADPSGVSESSTAVQAALAYAKTLPAGTEKTIYFPKGEYHFYADYSPVRQLYVSNTVGVNQSYVDKHLGILVEEMENVTIDGGGSQFIYHGDITAFAAIRSHNVTFTNFDVDHASPSVVDVTVESRVAGENAVILYVPPCYTYEIRNGNSIHWMGETGPVTGQPYWQGDNNLAYQQGFQTIDGHTQRGTGGPFSNVSSIADQGGGRLKVTYNSSSLPQVGMSYQLRNTTRTTPGTFFWECENVTVSNMNVQFLHGFGMVGQLSKNITLDGVNFAARPSSGRTTAGFADFVQMSSVGGKVTIQNCEFSNPHDDPINIHGTFLTVNSVSADNTTFTLKYQHNETGGFPQYYVGDQVDFATKGTMIPVEDSLRRVTAVVNPGEGGNDLNTITITLDRPVEGITGGNNSFVVENVTYTPEVLIKGNRFVETPTRGVLVTTRKKVVIEDNYFDRMGMAAIYISCDAQGWYESGHTEDVTIRNNVFIVDPRTASAPAILVEPTNPSEDPDRKIHSNMLIEGNTFNMASNQRAIDAKSVDTLTIRNNLIQRYDPNVVMNLSAQTRNITVGAVQATSLASSGTSYSTQIFRLNACKNVTIEDNTYDSGLNLGVALAGGTTASDVSVSGDNLAVGGSSQLPAVGNVLYFSSDPTVATVNGSGVVTGVGPGTAEIFAYTIGGARTFESNHLTFTVTEDSAAVKPESVKINASQPVFTPGQSLELTAEVTPADAGSVIWSVQDLYFDDENQNVPINWNGISSGASITQNGVLSAARPGIIEVTATVNGVSASKVFTIADIDTSSTLSQDWIVDRGVDGTWTPTAFNPVFGTEDSITIIPQTGGDWAGSNAGSNFFFVNYPQENLPTADENFSILVQLNDHTCRQGNCWCEAGLVVFQNADNYVSLTRKNAGGSPTLAISSEHGGSPAEKTIADVSSDVVYLRLDKVGSTYTGYYTTSLSIDYTAEDFDERINSAQWNQIGSFDNSLSGGLRYGFYACNAGTPHNSTQYSFTFQNFVEGFEYEGTVNWSGCQLADPAAESPAAWNLRLVDELYAVRSAADSGDEDHYADIMRLYWNSSSDYQEYDRVLWYASDTEDGPYTRIMERVLNPGYSTNNAFSVISAISGKWVKAVVVPGCEEGIWGAPVESAPAKVPLAKSVPYSTRIQIPSITNVEHLYATDGYFDETLETSVYPINVPASAQEVTLTADPVYSGTTVTGTGLVRLTGPRTRVEISATSEDSLYQTSTYVEICRALGNDANLSALTASAGTKSIAYTPGTRSYLLVADAGAGTLDFTAAAQSGADIAVRFNNEELGSYSSGMSLPLTAGLNHLELRVTAEDGVSTALYRVAVIKPASTDASLSALTVNGTNVLPQMENGKGIARLSSDRVVLNATAADSKASVRISVDGAMVENGTSITLTSHITTAHIRVIAEDGVTEQLYTLSLVKPDPASADLLDLTLGGISLSPAFNTDTTAYTATAYGSSSLNLTATAAEGGASVAYETVAQTGSGTGKVTGPCSMFLDNNGVNTVKVTVTSPDKSTTKTYTVTVTVVDSVYLSDIDWKSAGAGDTTWNSGMPVKDKAWENNPMSLTGPDGNEANFAKGLGTHANSTIIYDLSGMGFTTFTAKVGVSYSQRSSGNPHLYFTVKCDGEIMFTSGEMLASAAYKEINLDITGVKTLELSVTQPSNIWNAHANWADAKLAGDIPQLGDVTIPVSGITLDRESAALYTTGTDSSVTLNADVHPANATNKTLSWTSSDTSVATVNNGVVTAVGVGRATITAAAQDESGVSAACTVTVKARLDGEVNITGDAKFGSTLTASLNQLTPQGAKDGLTYQWNRDGNPISGAVSSTYVPVLEDIGADITVTVTATGYYEGTKTSASVTAAKADGPALEATPTHADCTEEGNDGKITGLYADRTYEYKLISASEWIPFTGSTEITGLAPGSYHVRRAETATHTAGPVSYTITILAYGSAAYDVNIPASFPGGRVTASDRRPEPGTVITLTVTPDTGYHLEDGTLKVTGASGNDIPVSAGLQFTMPAEDVTVSARFTKNTYTIVHNLSHINCSMEQDNHTVSYGDTPTITLIPEAGYNLPDTVTVTTSSGEPFFGYTYRSGVIAFNQGITEDLVISGAGTVKIYTVVYTLSQGLTAASAPQSVPHSSALNVTLRASEGYKLPERVTVTMGGSSFTDFSYDQDTGVISIAAGKIAGNIVITAAGVRITTPLTGVSIRGSAVVGQRLTAAIAPTGATAIYQWVRVDGDTETNIPNATLPLYILTADDAGKTIKVRATGTGRYSTTVVSDATDPVLLQAVIPVTGVTLDRNTASVAVNETVALTASVAPGNAANKSVTWSSSDETVATVDNGVVTGIAEGSATITVTTADGGFTASCEVTVTNGSAPQPAEFTVTFNSNGGSAVDAQTVTEGGKAVKPADPTRDNYTFEGWYTDEALTETYDFNAAITADITLYAKWTAVEVNPPAPPVNPGTPSTPVTPVTPPTTTETRENEDGTTTTIVTDNTTGTVTETTEKADGSVEVVETKADGTVTETTTDSEGGKVEKVTTPDQDMSITVTDKAGEVLAEVELPAAIAAPEIHFVDVPEGHWAEESINDMAALGLVNGVGGNRYDMNSPMTRGAFATILFRLSNGQPGLDVNFSDVAQGVWYADAAAWASKVDVVRGYSSDAFSVAMMGEATITREQLAVMLSRYAKLLGMDTTADTTALNAFADGSHTNEWAVDGVAWCVENGILQGKGNATLAPSATATRAEVAVMLRRFIALLKK